MRLSTSLLPKLTAKVAIGATVLAIGGVSALTGLTPAASASVPAPKLSAAMPTVPASAGTITRGAARVFHGTTGAAKAAAAGPSNNLLYGGGAATGTVSTLPGVYLVFYGSQWSQSDPLAVYLQKFMTGLYGTGDNWSAVAKQYCQGGGIAAGSQTCGALSTYVGSAPANGLVKGIWFDNASPAVPVDTLVNPTAGKTGDQIAAEATRAAAHFGNTSPTSNTNVQYVVATPSHFNTVGYGYYCAYHSAATSNYGRVAYTNLPYMTDFGLSCGQNSVNSGAAGTYDGVSIVEGHEFMETITDMSPSTGWTDSGGQENGDKCAWVTTGPGAMANLTLSTGTFAVQSTWSNAINGCAIHA